jgi:hypothetical protein
MAWKVFPLCVAAGLYLLSTCVAMNTEVEFWKLARQVMLQQWYSEERVRSEGSSGVKQVRHQRDGTRPYFTETHTGSGVASIHDHADSRHTLGMGEFVAVLNGVEFTTRHNDPVLVMPHKTSRKYHATEDIPFPEVPPSVSALPDVESQIKEMRQYFRAFKEQDMNIRDYRHYFKPVLCYLEGAWAQAEEEIEEPFFSERHWVAADTWKELEDRYRFMSYSGTKENLENLAFLPRMIPRFVNDTIQFAQWNYRILCHPLKQDLQTDRFRVVDDLASRMVTGMSLEQFEQTREARFTLHPTDSEDMVDSRYTHTLLDKLMEEIPGQDNYNVSFLLDETYGFRADEPTPTRGQPKNVGFYHHIFKVEAKDAMGLSIRHRGFSDEHLYVASTTQKKVVGMDFDNCYGKWASKSDCHNFHQKWTYAIPLEIVYLTPLSRWNPYNIAYHGSFDGDAAKTVTDNSRNGSKAAPYDGTHSRLFYRTPAAFYADEEYSVRPADTTGGSFYVLDKSGTAREVRGSGHRTFLPDIAGVGRIRQRYPIMPVHGEGGSVWKELEALKDIVLKPDNFKHMLHSGSGSSSGSTGATCWLEPSLPHYGEHTHSFQLHNIDKEVLKNGGSVLKLTTEANSHQHYITLETEQVGRKGYAIKMTKCGDEAVCWDGHSQYLREGFSLDWRFVEDVAALKEEPVTKKTSGAEGLCLQGMCRQWALLWAVFVIWSCIC